MSPHAIIAEDEAALAEYLRRRLAALWPELAIDGVAVNGPEALQLIEATQPQIAFLDIKMPGLTGLEVAEQAGKTTHIVFVTAYDEFAVPAFEREAVDYLVKPVTDERLQRTITRLKARVGSRDAPTDLTAVLNELLRRTREPGAQWLRWIRAGLGDTVRQIPVEQVIYFDAADKYTRVITADGESLIRVAIKELEAQLDPQMFARIHRSTIVNLQHVARLHRSETGHLELHLTGRKEVLSVSRAHAAQFRQM